MAIQALNSAATGLRALSTAIDVTANNLANAETTAFKRSRVNFEDLMYVTLRQPGAQNSNGDITPTGIFVGLGVKVSNTTIDTEQGPIENTNGPLDVAIQGNGFFKVSTIDSIGNGRAYTRAGNFVLNNEGDLVLNIGDGYRVDPPINIPPGSTEISIGLDGRVSYLRPGATTRTEAGQLELAQFTNPQGLKLIGGSLYIETEASGPPIESIPGENGAGQTLQGYLEGSNVDPVKELISLIKTQRAFELNSQSIQTADQALQTIGNLRRF
ncbi:flagellar basal-body rod protein FlgG [Fontivita pretiosa]|jgi:flagellar basal-body rod protein FlgG|uniref:flagellar basal-body rod protein FlgG n=1 Tax=Fontivita pretiosa TaxID=2989684 RepID=UPI003D17EBBB